MKIFDCVTYLNEDHLLDLRFNILNEYVDFFVICEAKEDHRGKKKKLNFDHKKFIKFKEKIIYLVVEKFKNCERTWDRQNYQRDYLINGITKAKRYPSTLHPFPCVISIDFFKESTIPSSNMTAK